MLTRAVVHGPATPALLLGDTASGAIEAWLALPGALLRVETLQHEPYHPSSIVSGERAGLGRLGGPRHSAGWKGGGQGRPTTTEPLSTLQWLTDLAASIRPTGACPEDAMHCIVPTWGDGDGRPVPEPSSNGVVPPRHRDRAGTACRAVVARVPALFLGPAARPLWAPVPCSNGEEADMNSCQ